MNKAKTYSGFTEDTAKNLLLDAGAFFVNYDILTDTFESAIPKLLGATRGGGTFTAIPTMRAPEVDGVKGPAKGLQFLDFWDTGLAANVLEITKDSLAKALVSSKVDSITNEDYHIIKANNYIELTDYIDNVTWVGRLSGNSKPAIIQVFNALNGGGLTLQTQDKDEAVLALDFKGHYEASELDSPPFAIYYPKDDILNIAEVDITTLDKYTDTNDIEFTVLSNRTGVACTGVKESETALTVDTDYTIVNGKVTLLNAYLVGLAPGEYIFELIMDKGNNIVTEVITITDTTP